MDPVTTWSLGPMPMVEHPDRAEAAANMPTTATVLCSALRETRILITHSQTQLLDAFEIRTLR
jgi:hypothetical protein